MSLFGVIILILILMNTFYMGFNDGSNAIATTVATRAIKPFTAVMIAAATQFIVPIIVYLISSSFTVAGNIAGKTIAGEYISNIDSAKGFIFLLSAMMGAISWGLIAYKLKVPNSVSHTLSGGLIGTSIIAFGFNSVLWKEFVLLNVVLMVALAPIIGLIVSFLLMKLVKRLARVATNGFATVLTIIQRINVIVLASAFSNNNFQKSLGIYMLMVTFGIVTSTGNIPLWIVIAISGAMTLGLLLGGYRIINTLGRKIFKIKAEHSVVAQLTTGILMTVATSAGISVSTGQIMSSSIMGVGAAERVNRVKWNMAKRIVISWFLTLPISAAMSACYYLVIGKWILGF